MPGNIDPAAQARRKKEAWQSVIMATLVRLASVVLLWWLRLRTETGSFLSAFLLLLILFDLGSIIPVWILLKTRLKEIEGGEEDAAAQY